MTTGSQDPSGNPGRLVARYLRQRREMGTEGLHLVHLDPGETLATLGQVLASGTMPTFRAARPGTGPEAVPADSPMAPPAVPVPSSGGAQGGKIERSEPGRVEGAGNLSDLHAACAGCTQCGLARTRTQVVVADGNPSARVMVVGEAPGANEDAQGLPFVGAAGKLLDLLLRCVDLSREEDVYICNVIKCRPPGNRNPTADEIAACSPWLHRQVELVAPQVILAVGTFAGQLLSGSEEPLGRLRGELRAYRGIPLVVTYHPAALLRNSGWILPTWEDLQLLRQLLGSTPDAQPSPTAGA